MSRAVSWSFALLIGMLACPGCVHPPAPAGSGSAAIDVSTGSELTLVVGETRTLVAEQLSITLLAIDDRRCPPDVVCIWAGHASIQLRLVKPDSEPAIRTLGTEAPPSMRLPYDACYAGLGLHLVSLDRHSSGPAGKAGARPKATIRVRAGCESDPGGQPELALSADGVIR